ncbi:MAG: hypothetical protein A3J24_11025 [Deltaproteobacteria bacterium RIFCSPLOWO2_02_FULL_53_8]|nr:MAG: hypothetical protein A3J24_11025 [Deltaproteobacteria bacterium RIFCSPLOWO2_02_FULL_53_8]
MVKGPVKKIISFFGNDLKERGVKISKIILFGSYSTGKASEGSDIDVAVISEDFVGKDIFARVKMIKDAEVATIRKFMVPLDVVAMTPDEYENGASLVAAYAKRGVVVG